MNPDTLRAFQDELYSITKHASMADAFLTGGELLGLGLLAKPSIDTLKNPRAKKIDINHAKWELAGLGTLAGATLGYEGIKNISKIKKVFR